MGLVVDGQLYFVVEYNHVKPGKGSAFVRVRLKNIRTDAVLERTYRSAETLEEADLERRRMQFTYATGMNTISWTKVLLKTLLSQAIIR